MEESQSLAPPTAHSLYLPSLADSKKPDFHQHPVHAWGHSTAWSGSPWAERKQELVCCCCCRSRVSVFEVELSQRSTLFTSEKITNVCQFVEHICSWHKWWRFITDEALVTIKCFVNITFNCKKGIFDLFNNVLLVFTLIYPNMFFQRTSCDIQYDTAASKASNQEHNCCNFPVLNSIWLYYTIKYLMRGYMKARHLSAWIASV